MDTKVKIVNLAAFSRYQLLGAVDNIITASQETRSFSSFLTVVSDITNQPAKASLTDHTMDELRNVVNQVQKQSRKRRTAEQIRAALSYSTNANNTDIINTNINSNNDININIAMAPANGTSSCSGDVAEKARLGQTTLAKDMNESFAAVTAPAPIEVEQQSFFDQAFFPEEQTEYDQHILPEQQAFFEQQSAAWQHVYPAEPGFFEPQTVCAEQAAEQPMTREEEQYLWKTYFNFDELHPEQKDAEEPAVGEQQIVAGKQIEVSSSSLLAHIEAARADEDQEEEQSEPGRSKRRDFAEFADETEAEQATSSVPADSAGEKKRKFIVNIPGVTWCDRCGKPYSKKHNADKRCLYHPGLPNFWGNAWGCCDMDNNTHGCYNTNHITKGDLERLL